MKQKKSILFVLLPYLIIFCTFSVGFTQQQNNEIIWYHAKFPPVTIPSGPEQGSGFYDKINQAIIDKLPEYNHRFVVANYQRILIEIKEGQQVCCASLYKTNERAKYTQFSIPAVVVLPSGITLKKSDRHLFDPYITNEGKIQLAKALKDPDLILGVANGRKFSGGIDELLSQHGKESNILRRAGSDVFQGLLEMLLRGRIHYLLGYPVEAQYLAKQTGQQDDILFFPIKEIGDALTWGQFGCSNTPEGKEIIGKINKILLEHRDTPEFYRHYENWLDHQTTLKYRNIANEFFNSENH